MLNERLRPLTSANWSDTRRLSHATCSLEFACESSICFYTKNAQTCHDDTMDLRSLRTAAAEEDYKSMAYNIDYT